MNNSLYFQFSDDSVLNISDPIEHVLVEDKKIIICFLRSTGREDFFVDYPTEEEKKEDLQKFMNAWSLSLNNQPASPAQKRKEKNAIEEEIFFLQVGFGWLLLIVDVNLVLTLLLIPSNISKFFGIVLGVITLIYLARIFINKIK